MEQIQNVLQDLIGKFPVVSTVLLILGALVVLAQVVVVLTPTKKDDEILDKIQKNSIGGAVLDLLKSFSPFQKKPEGGLVSSAKSAKSAKAVK